MQDGFVQLMQTLAPDLAQEMALRALVLERIAAMAPVGRRQLAAKLGRAARPDIHLGICGEHGGEPSSVEFCHRTGLDYVSCSPFRVPIARLAAAQAQIKYPR